MRLASSSLDRRRRRLCFRPQGLLHYSFCAFSDVASEASPSPRPLKSKESRDEARRV
ncbi:hypothetical protein F2Q70_00003533 [Brassica cretica]|uniref:Uncharacterized protein n=1 Tax=Brassica cretica TaxID=69181 RepID=A0A8S9IMG4_BRACR|nr:hypothetical protein F2Q70_00003533 [Brassica cretica]